MEVRGAKRKPEAAGALTAGWNRSNSGSEPALVLRFECNSARSDLPTYPGPRLVNHSRTGDRAGARSRCERAHRRPAARRPGLLL